MEEKTRPYRMEANAGVDLEVETENEGTEIAITAQGKWDIPSGAFSARIILYLCQKGTARTVAVSSTQEISCPFGAPKRV